MDDMLAIACYNTAVFELILHLLPHLEAVVLLRLTAKPQVTDEWLLYVTHQATGSFGRGAAED